jgi:hypothetical protein
MGWSRFDGHHGGRRGRGRSSDGSPRFLEHGSAPCTSPPSPSRENSR